MRVGTVVIASNGSALAARAEPVAAWVAGAWGGSVRRLTVTGDVVDGVAAAITEMDSALPCLATHARNRTVPLLGSVAHDLLEATWSPALLVGPDGTREGDDRGQLLPLGRRQEQAPDP